MSRVRDRGRGFGPAPAYPAVMRAVLVVAVLALLAPVSASAEPPDDSGPLPTIAAPSAESHIDPNYSRAVVRLIRRSVEVRCWSAEDWGRLSDEIVTAGGFPLTLGSGYVSSDHERINLGPDACAQLALLVYRKVWPRVLRNRFALAQAVAILSHEAQHIAGFWAEHVAECYGQQRIAPLARLLGVTVERARVLANVAWRYTYPALPATYRSVQCRNGGKLDLHPRSNVWP